MFTKIDWISFSVAVSPASKPTELTAFSAALVAFHELYSAALGVLVDNRRWTVGKGRAPYSVSFEQPESKIRLYCHPTLPHALFEISGQACDWLDQRSMLLPLLKATASRVTRIDIAVDFQANTTPATFAEARDTEKFRSHGHIISESGTTYYVGSRTSDRYARVYRYNPPHERSHLLRCEMVVKGQAAKLAANEITVKGLLWYSAALGHVFKWSHPLWDAGKLTSDKPESYRAERREGKTLFWLNDTVAPLLARLHRDGILDVVQWVEEQIFPKIDDPYAK